MSDEELPIVFTGTDGLDPVRFISRIRRIAVSQGRSRDEEWLVDFTTSCFQGDAFHWHLGLPVSTQVNWPELVAALVKKYPPRKNSLPQSPISIRGEAPAAAPAAGPSNLPCLISLPLVGRLRIIAGDFRAGTYISRLVEPDTGVHLSCDDVADALTVRITPSASIQGIEIMDLPSPYNWLGSLRNSSDPLSPTFSGFSNLAPLSRPDSQPIGTNVTPPYGQLKAAIWSYNPIDDSVQALLQDGGCTYLMATAVNVGNRRLLLVTNFSAFCDAFPENNYALVRLILERI